MGGMKGASMERLMDAIRGAKRVGCLTGAGISTLCGIPDFRGPQGLYKQPDAERIFDIDWFDRDPSIYYRGCRELVYGLKNFRPGPVHKALKLLEDAGKLRGIATQNIDLLHQKAGSKVVWEVHGSPLLHHCRRCGAEKSFEEVCAMLGDGDEPKVPRCPCGGVFKPDITFFGESLPEAAWVGAERGARESDVYLVLGTSLTVYPAASLPQVALRSGAKVFIVNGQETPLDGLAEGRWGDWGEFAAAVEAAFGRGEP